ncbi:uncharacterized protein LOC105664064 [Megachile rotundata]|uniref:uncharacterized protein LOC105664064 n=1 Tax=Megachile rotundata TaxID=143995 RepID=UPI003FD662C5
MEYGSTWYFPTDVRSRNVLEGIQMEALRLAMGYRKSTPTNVILAETKILNFKDRTIYLGSKYILKLLTNSSNPMVNILSDFCEIYKNESISFNSKRNRDRPLVHIIKLIEEYTPLLNRLPNLVTNTMAYSSQLVQCSLESVFISELRNSLNTIDIFQDTILNKYSGHKTIFTDGSKSDGFPAVGAACIIPADNFIARMSIPKQSSVFTAECIALEMALSYVYNHQQGSYVICTDSLSLVQALIRPGVKPFTNIHLINIKNTLRLIKEESPDVGITFMWIPSHKGIPGNELADSEAKTAAHLEVLDIFSVPCTDIFPLLKQKIVERSQNELVGQAIKKGAVYFNNYFSGINSKPWFHNKKLSRHLTVWINRARSNHFNLKISLKKINVVQDTKCQCGHFIEDIDHVLWDCTVFQQHRKEMLNRLKCCKLSLPYKIRNFLIKPNITVLKIIDAFLMKNNIRL